MSPLNKMKSMSQVGGGDRKIYQGPGKINIWMGKRQEQRGVSLHLFRQFPASSWTKEGCQSQPSSWPTTGGRPGWTEADTQGKRRLKRGLSPWLEQGGHQEPQGCVPALTPGSQFPHLKCEGLARDAFRTDDLRLWSRHVLPQ